MKIIKYRKMSGGKYKVTTDTFDLVLYEEVILKYNLLITKEIDPLDVEKISNDNMYYEVYYSALNSIKSRFRSVYDMRVLLTKKEYPTDMIDYVIDKLLEQGYLNDLSFTKAFINNQMITTNKGPNKIKQELLEHKVDCDIDKELEVFDLDLQLEKMDKLANRFYKSNRNRGGNVLRQKITNDLYNYGYNGSLIDKVLSNYDFSNDKELAKKEYDKLYRKLSRKYNGSELERKIREKMYMKGLKYEEDY
ncbi:MAG: RecX family transcriptional regulator [Bacilli bacterium]|nr:RecX family transcriptional regulator [Bacilli bacterium]